MIIYTSGTTGRPKGVVHTQGSLGAQIAALVEAWGWTADDRILLVLPLHHVHGIINVRSARSPSAPCCDAPGGFDADAVWERLASGEITRVHGGADDLQPADRVVGGAPTRRPADAGPTARAALRLMVSGSAALPVPTLERWREITGHTLLERYGMTEIGMALSNPLDRRVPGYVGAPLPGVEVRLVDEPGGDVAGRHAGRARGARPAGVPRVLAAARGDHATAFRDGWFRTGDMAVLEPARTGCSAARGSTSSRPAATRCRRSRSRRCCARIRDRRLRGGRRRRRGVGRARVPRPSCCAAAGRRRVDELRAWGKERLAASKVPSRFVFVDDLPRNALGKVVKARGARAVLTRSVTDAPYG